MLVIPLGVVEGVVWGGGPGVGKSQSLVGWCGGFSGDDGFHTGKWYLSVDARGTVLVDVQGRFLQTSFLDTRNGFTPAGFQGGCLFAADGRRWGCHP